MTVSIIIPTYNRPERLAKCLAAIAQQDYPADEFEVIVVDDGSDTPLDDVIEEYRKTLQIQLIRQPNSGPATARNTGAKHARGTCLAFTDDDCAPSPTWLKYLVSRCNEVPDTLVGGYTVNALTSNWFAEASQQLVTYLYEYFNIDKQKARFFTSNNIVLPAEFFHKIGGFDARFPLAAGEDREFCDRWLFKGGQMVYVPQAILRHYHRMNFFGFWRQHFNYGRGAFCFHTVRRQRYKAPFKLEPPSFYLQLLYYPFSQSPTLKGALVTLLLVISQLANVLGFFTERRKRPDGFANIDAPLFNKI